MSDISAIQNYLLTYQNLEADRPIWVEMLQPEPTAYTVFLVPGKQVMVDLAGNKTVEYPFGFGATEALDENSTLQTAEFYEEFADWLESQSEAGILPTMDAGKTATWIEALDTATIIQRATTTGVFQILCKLTYEQLKGN
jgi:hypothetical protein